MNKWIMLGLGVVGGIIVGRQLARRELARAGVVTFPASGSGPVFGGNVGFSFGGEPTEAELGAQN